MLLQFTEGARVVYFRNGDQALLGGTRLVCFRFLLIPLGRPRRRWEDNIRMDLQEVGLGYEDWIGLAQDAVRNLRVP